MKVQRVYIDTSVIGGCLDQEFALWSKGIMRDFREGNFRPVISTVVAAEVSRAYESVQQQYAELLELRPEVLTVTEEATELAEVYQRRQILTSKFYDDGLHIAIASVADVDLLVSWNFRHIVHFDRIRLFNVANLEMGYKSIQIYSPREVTHYGEE
jgi:predicted nucleic acid-binding protein